jgi:hypothetical protein
MAAVEFDDTPYAKFHVDYAHTRTGAEGLLETYGDDLARVRLAPRDHVWTVLQGGDDNLYVSAGFHLVNRLAYFISEVPWESDDEYYLWCSFGD